MDGRTGEYKRPLPSTDAKIHEWTGIPCIQEQWTGEQMINNYWRMAKVGILYT